MTAREIRFGIFHWTGDGRYYLSECAREFVNESTAQKCADRWNADPAMASDWVVRTLRFCLSERSAS